MTFERTCILLYCSKSYYIDDIYCNVILCCIILFCSISAFLAKNISNSVLNQWSLCVCKLIDAGTAFFKTTISYLSNNLIAPIVNVFVFMYYSVSCTERIQSEAQISDWRLGGPSEDESGDTHRDKDIERPRECDSSSSSLVPLQMYLGSSSSESSTTDSLSSSQQSIMGGQSQQYHTCQMPSRWKHKLLWSKFQIFPDKHTLSKKTKCMLESKTNIIIWIIMAQIKDRINELTNYKLNASASKLECLIAVHEINYENVWII